MIFEKMMFPKICYFSLLIGILTPGSINVERGMKKYPVGLNFHTFWPDGKPIGAAEAENGARTEARNIFRILPLLCAPVGGGH